MCRIHDVRLPRRYSQDAPTDAANAAACGQSLNKEAHVELGEVAGGAAQDPATLHEAACFSSLATGTV
jgi:hypothetical protein